MYGVVLICQFLFILDRVVEARMTLEPTQLSEHAKNVAAMLKLVSNPFRLMILCCLSEGEQTVG